MRKKSSRIETFENQVYSQDTVASYVQLLVWNI